MYGRPASADVVTFCKRELMHASLMCIIDAEFVSAYHHRIVVECADSVVWRVFP